MSNLHVAVLMGGISAERGVSLRSGAAVATALARQGLRVTTVDVHGPDVELPRDVAVAFVTLHGTFGEDGRVQQLLEERGVPYTFSGPAASALAFDKMRAKRQFVADGVLTPRYEVLERGTADFQRVDRLKLPLVVKPSRQGSSVGVTIVRKMCELAGAVQTAGEYDTHVLVEQFVEGRELTVAILEDQVLPVIEVRPRHGWFTFDAKYTPGQTEYLVPAPLDEELCQRAQSAARRAHQSLGCRDLSRVDLILATSGKVHVLEVNTVPGFTATSLVPKAAQAAGIEFGALCQRLVDLALARRAAPVHAYPVVAAVAATRPAVARLEAV